MIVAKLFHHIYDKRFIYQLLASLSTYLSIRLFCFVRTRKRRYQLFKYYGIPGPEPTLLSGNFGVYNVEAKFKIDRQFVDTYGKVWGYFLGDDPSMMITDLEMLNKIFFEESGKTLKERAHRFLDTTLTDGILFARHNRWKVMRKLLGPHFSQYKLRGDSATQFIERSIKLMIDYVDQKLDKATDGKTNIRIHKLMKATSLHLISDMAIKLPDVGVSENEQNVEILDEFMGNFEKGAVNLAIVFPPMRTALQFVADHFEQSRIMSLIHRKLNQLIDASVKEAKLHGHNGKPSENLLDTLINSYLAGKLTRKEVIGNADSILIAGYDSTSTSLACVFWILAKHPKVQDELRRELAAHGIESEYLLQVINETLRLYPPVSTVTTRVATETVEVNGWVIPQGTRVVHNAWLMHHEPDIWPAPDTFDPSRFRKGADIHPCAFAPFGLGDRKCLGYHLAMLEMKMIVCDILLRYRLRLVSPETLEVVSKAIEFYAPKEELVIEMERL